MIRQLSVSPGEKIDHDDGLELHDMKRGMPAFFDTGDFFGAREHIQAYRGFLIVRNTPVGSGRVTIIYAYVAEDADGRPSTICLQAPNDLSIRQAKRLIDRILDKTHALPYCGVVTR